MEEKNNQISNLENREDTDNPIEGYKRNFYPLLIAGILILIIVLIGIKSYLPKKEQSQAIKNNHPSVSISPSSSQAQQINLNNFFLFAIPKPIKNLTVYDLPNYANFQSVITIGDSLWLTGDGAINLQSTEIGGSIIEYNTKSGKIVSYSDPQESKL